MSRTLIALAFVLALATPGLALAQHGPADHGSAPAAQVAAPKPSSAAADVSKQANSATTKPALAPRAAPANSRGKNANERALGSVITRIQERIATETGPNATKPSGSSTAANAPKRAAEHGTTTTAAAAPAASSAKSTRLVTLQWRVALDWPADLVSGPTAEQPSKIDLKW